METSWYQGTFTPTNPDKWINKDKISFRSSWECRFCNWLDQNPAVKKCGFEVVTIPYRFEIDGKIHKYTIDFYAEILNNNNVLDKYLIEIKPKHQSVEPIMPKRKSAKSMKNFLYEAKQYIRNQNKWKYAEQYCKANGFNWKVLNENKLF